MFFRVLRHCVLVCHFDYLYPSLLHPALGVQQQAEIMRYGEVIQELVRGSKLVSVDPSHARSAGNYDVTKMQNEKLRSLRC